MVLWATCTGEPATLGKLGFNSWTLVTSHSTIQTCAQLPADSSSWRLAHWGRPRYCCGREKGISNCRDNWARASAATATYLALVTTSSQRLTASVGGTTCRARFRQLALASRASLISGIPKH